MNRILDGSVGLQEEHLEEGNPAEEVSGSEEQNLELTGEIDDTKPI